MHGITNVSHWLGQLSVVKEKASDQWKGCVGQSSGSNFDRATELSHHLFAALYTVWQVCIPTSSSYVQQRGASGVDALQVTQFCSGSVAWPGAGSQDTKQAQLQRSKAREC